MAFYDNWATKISSLFSGDQPVRMFGLVLSKSDNSPDLLQSNGYGALKSSATSTAATLGALVTVAATKAQFASSACQAGVLIQADLANTGICSIGDSTLTTSNGIQLQAGDSVFVPVANANLLYNIGTVTTDKLRVLAL